MPTPRRTESLIPKALEVAPTNFHHSLTLEPLQWLHQAFWSPRALFSHRSSSHIYQSSRMNRRLQAEYSLNLSSHPRLHDPLLNNHPYSLSTLNWLQPLNYSPHPYVALVVLSRRCSTITMFIHLRWELLQCLHKTLRLQ